MIRLCFLIGVNMFLIMIESTLLRVLRETINVMFVAVQFPPLTACHMLQIVILEKQQQQSCC
jgi:hypothetical protein